MTSQDFYKLLLLKLVLWKSIIKVETVGLSLIFVNEIIHPPLMQNGLWKLISNLIVQKHIDYGIFNTVTFLMINRPIRRLTLFMIIRRK